jgi:hypothetical protein
MALKGDVISSRRAFSVTFFGSSDPPAQEEILKIYTIGCRISSNCFRDIRHFSVDKVFATGRFTEVLLFINGSPTIDG